jgi:hypothetical protein
VIHATATVEGSPAELRRLRVLLPARFANGDVDRPLLPSEQARLVEAATARFPS